jgi:hypothetical protein
MGLGLSTVHGWARRGSLPVWRANQIRVLARKRKLDVYVVKKRKRRKKAA